jgi:predicted nucleic acid-binding protein
LEVMGSMSNLQIQHTSILLDTCCLINLHVSQKLPQILQSLQTDIVVVETVRHEAGNSRTEDHLNRGCFRIEDFTEEEAELFFYILANEIGMDDGEAAVAALAIIRSWGAITDDKRARNYFQLRAPQIQLISTPEIISHWAYVTGASPQDIQQVVSEIETVGRFRPNKDFPLYSWWKQYSQN